jgi:hypothetical protein
MIPFLVAAAVQLQAVPSVVLPIPPPTSSISAWTSLKIVPAEACEFGLFSEVNLSRLWAFKVGNPVPIRFGDVIDPDYVPDGGSPAGIAVYEKKNQWCLIHSGRMGWCWVLLRADELVGMNDPPLEDPSKAIYRAFEFPAESEGIESSTPDGWFTYTYLTIVNPKENEQLRVNANLKSKSLGLVKGEYLRILDRKGDWVKVQESLEIQMVPAGDDKVDYLKVKWNPRRIGWVRWKVPGPVPGSSIKFLRGRQYFGIID